MEKTTVALRDRLRTIARSSIPLIFYIIIGMILVTSELPEVKTPAFITRHWLFSGQELPFKSQDPGRFFSIFEPYRTPQDPRVSFLTDEDYDPRDPGIEKLQAAQGRLAPTLLNPAPGERLAFVFCSNTAIAAKRLQVTGYRMTHSLGNGKGIAEKL